MRSDAGEHDEVMLKVGEAVALHCRGDRAAARGALAALWDAIGPTGDALHRCTVAHFMADVQDDPRDALAWDLRALDAADGLGDARARRHHPSLSVRAFYPSLHLNLAEDYRRLGELDRAREHLALADAVVETLPDEERGVGIREALDGLRERLAEGA